MSVFTKAHAKYRNENGPYELMEQTPSGKRPLLSKRSPPRITAANSPAQSTSNSYPRRRMWTNKFDIMRDLSLAQGCVPADIGRTIGEADKPPALDIVEETEEQFFQHCSGDAAILQPDLGLIKTMLNLVRVDGDSDSEDNSTKLIEITKSKVYNVNNHPELNKDNNHPNSTKQGKEKLNPNVPEFIPSQAFYRPTPEGGDFHPKVTTTLTNVTTAPTPVTTAPRKSITLPAQVADSTKLKVENIQNKPPKRTAINVAMNSLLEKRGEDVTHKFLHKPKDTKENQCNNISKSIPLTKPDHYTIQSKNANENTLAVGKVNTWLETNECRSPTIQKEPPKRSKKNELLLTKPMFKRKGDSPPKGPITYQEAPKVSHEIKEYRPSKWAETYCKTFEERANMQVILSEDVWARAERRMREIDFNRNLELLKFQASMEQTKQNTDTVQSSMVASETEQNTNTEPESEGTEYADKEFLAVLLPQHRHLLTGECIVCETFKKHQKDENLNANQKDETYNQKNQKE